MSSLRNRGPTGLWETDVKYACCLLLISSSHKFIWTTTVTTFMFNTKNVSDAIRVCGFCSFGFSLRVVALLVHSLPFTMFFPLQLSEFDYDHCFGFSALIQLFLVFWFSLCCVVQFWYSVWPLFFVSVLVFSLSLCYSVSLIVSLWFSLP